MAFSTATIADVAKDPGGSGIPFAIVVSYPSNSFSNAGSAAAAHLANANAAGVFSLGSLESTDDAATTCTDTTLTDMPFQVPQISATNHYGTHHVFIFDPHTGERVFDADVVIPTGAKPTNLATLAACAV